MGAQGNPKNSKYLTNRSLTLLHLALALTRQRRHQEAMNQALDALQWAEDIGGLTALIARSEANLAAIADWVAATNWIDFLAKHNAERSSTSVCLQISDPWFAAKPEDEQRALVKKLVGLLASEGAAYDINAYRDAPPGLRLWAGATVERSDLEALFPWLEWAYGELHAAEAA